MTKPETKADALLDDLLQGCESPEEILGEHGLLKGLTKRLVERALAAELTHPSWVCAASPPAVES